MTNYKYYKYIDEYMALIENEVVPSSKELKMAMPYIRSKLDNPDVFIDADKIERAVELMQKYFEITLLDWELFIISLVHCYYRSSDTVVFDEFFIMMGRGNGKNGFISALAWYLTTPDHGIKGYNVDIIANSEEQAKTSFDDVYNMLENHWGKLKKFYYKSKEIIRSLKTGSYVKYNTSNAKTKDGKRSACLIFDEKHEYENSKTIGVFSSGFGKKKHSRIFSITTNGYVREGVLDDDIALAEQVLYGDADELGLCPLIYKADNEDDISNPEMWHKANPSLRFFPELKKQMEKEFKKMKYDKQTELDFYTKRMNLPRSKEETPVTEWDNIAATNKPLPNLTGWSCVVGIDYAMINDFASVIFHFKKDEERFDISHSWLCLKSPELYRIKAPWEKWADEGLITPVNDVSIHPDLIANYIMDLGKKYNIKKLCMDHFRYALVSESLRRIGFDADTKKNIKLIRPSDIYKVQPIINNCFIRRHFTWGNDPVLRWATNNAKVLASGKKQGTDTGNFYYGKIEGKSRKTDPFMALVHAMTEEGLLDVQTAVFHDIPVITL